MAMSCWPAAMLLNTRTLVLASAAWRSLREPVRCPVTMNVRTSAAVTDRIGIGKGPLVAGRFESSCTSSLAAEPTAIERQGPTRRLEGPAANKASSPCRRSVARQQALAEGGERIGFSSCAVTAKKSHLLIYRRLIRIRLSGWSAMAENVGPMKTDLGIPVTEAVTWGSRPANLMGTWFQMIPVPAITGAALCTGAFVK
jgi:hypothetical protein